MDYLIHFKKILAIILTLVVVSGCNPVSMEDQEGEGNPFEDNVQQQSLTSKSWCGIGQMTYPYNMGEILLRTLFKVDIGIDGTVSIATLSLDRTPGLRNNFYHSCTFIDATVLRCYSYDIHFVIENQRISTLLLTKLVNGPEIQNLMLCRPDQLQLFGE